MKTKMFLLAMGMLVSNGALGQEAQEPLNAYDIYAPVESIPVGYMMIEGDIVVPENFYEMEGVRAGYGTIFWPGGIVPFEFDANVTAANQTTMINTMAEWEAVVNVNFIPRAGESNFIYIQNATFNASEGIGMAGGRHDIWIASWTNMWIIAHELGHALAYWHEQSRTDRGTFVQINWENICQTCCSGDTCNPQFNVRSSGGEYGPYDFDSVMHYGLCSFDNCGCDPRCGGCGPPPVGQTSCPTITVIPPYDTSCVDSSIVQCPTTTIGQRTHLSQWDERVMSFLYPETDWVFADVTYSGGESGTFIRPFNTFTEGYAAMSIWGTLWLLQPGTYSTGGILDIAGTIRAPLRGVILNN